MNEIWKDIKGYEGFYQISNLGRIKSLKRINSNKCRKDKILKLRIDERTGYMIRRLCKDYVMKTVKAHILVWDSFGDGNREGKQVDHIDENKENNRIENLQLLSPRMNKGKERLNNKISKLPIGVHLHKQSGKYRAKIYIKGKHIHLGLFVDSIQASNAYNKKLISLGEVV